MLLAKCFSFDIVVLLHTLVKLVRSHHRLFVCCLYFLLLLFLLPFVVNKTVQNMVPHTNHDHRHLKQLEWSPLSVRRRNSRLVAFYKAVNNMSPVAVGQPRTCSHQTRSHDPLTFTPLTPQTDYYKYSFLPLTIVDWNSLPFSLRAKPLVDSFRAGLQHLTVSTSSQ